MKKLLLSLTAAATLFVSNVYALDNKTEQKSAQAVQNAENKAQIGVVKEAVKALEYTNYALINLQKNDVAKAKIYIKKAIGELTDVLTRPNAPYLLPVDVNVKAYQFQGNEKDIKDLLNKTKNLLEDNKVVEAREILNVLRSEIEVDTLNLPLATYPSNLKLALKYINENKVVEATDILKMALTTLVETKTIIPIPLVKAEYLLREAKKIVKDNKKQALKYIDEAKHQLKIAELLGYTSKSNSTYKSLKDEITNLEDKINDNEDVKSIFEKLIKKLEDFKEKAITTTK